jgi:cold-inducible RNA-binding protein
MSNKLYVGGLSYSTSESDLHDLFAELGTVVSAVVINDRDSGRSKGFGFVEMASPEDATKAINELNGKNVDGRNIMVNEARERAPRSAPRSSRW